MNTQDEIAKTRIIAELHRTDWTQGKDAYRRGVDEAKRLEFEEYRQALYEIMNSGTPSEQWNLPVKPTY